MLPIAEFSQPNYIEEANILKLYVTLYTPFSQAPGKATYTAAGER